MYISWGSLNRCWLIFFFQASSTNNKNLNYLYMINEEKFLCTSLHYFIYRNISRKNYYIPLKYFSMKPISFYKNIKIAGFISKCLFHLCLYGEKLLFFYSNIYELHMSKSYNKTLFSCVIINKWKTILQLPCIVFCSSELFDKL